MCPLRFVVNLPLKDWPSLLITTQILFLSFSTYLKYFQTQLSLGLPLLVLELAIFICAYNKNDAKMILIIENVVYIPRMLLCLKS